LRDFRRLNDDCPNGYTGLTSSRLLKQGAKARIKVTQDTTPSEPPELKAPHIRLPPLWLKYPFFENRRLE
jgi:hypothetical protein